MADYGPIKIRQASLDELNKLYQETYKKVAQELVDSAGAKRIQKARVMARINYELSKLGVDGDKILKEELSKYYYDGANQALQDLRDLDVNLSPSASAAINKEAVAALVDEAVTLYGQGIAGISRNASNIISTALRQNLNLTIAQGKITGSARKMISAAVEKEIRDRGIGSLTDKAGRSWSLDSYTEMLVRTKGVEARNQGLANKMVSYGFDLVQVSNHGTQHKACRAWEGKILSLTGQTPTGAKLLGGYSVAGTVDEAKAAGLFHPNCKHAINVFTPRLAAATKAYDNPYLKMSDAERAQSDLAFIRRSSDTL